MGFKTINPVGMCMRYGLYINETYANDKSLLAHELVHTQQYERLGGLLSFLYLYFKETLILGYSNAPLELEADGIAKAVLA